MEGQQTMIDIRWRIWQWLNHLAARKMSIGQSDALKVTISITNNSGAPILLYTGRADEALLFEVPAGASLTTDRGKIFGFSYKPFGREWWRG